MEGHGAWAACVTVVSSPPSPPSTLTQIQQTAIYDKEPAGFTSPRLFRHFLRLKLQPSWQRLELYALEDESLAALGIGPETTLQADLAERGGGLAFDAQQPSLFPSPTLVPSQHAPPPPQPYAADFLIRLPKGMGPDLCLEARVGDIRELPSSPRHFMAKVRGVYVRAPLRVLRVCQVGLLKREMQTDISRFPYPT